MTNDTYYNISGLTRGTSYVISVVPSVGPCQGEGKEMMADTTDHHISITSMIYLFHF